MKNNLHKMESEFLKIIELIKSISGQKILTLATEDVFTIDVDKSGKFGYAEEHFFLFKAKLTRALNQGGGLIIRQFLDIKFEYKAPNGKVIWIPMKKIYGLLLGYNTWQPLSEQQVREAYCREHQTGRLIECETGVVFSDLPSNIVNHDQR